MLNAQCPTPGIEHGQGNPRATFLRDRLLQPHISDDLKSINFAKETQGRPHDAPPQQRHTIFEQPAAR
jgi:hypothetical protein